MPVYRPKKYFLVILYQRCDPDLQQRASVPIDRCKRERVENGSLSTVISFIVHTT